MHGHSAPASFYASPREAQAGARAEEFPYLLCLHEGTGVDAPSIPRRRRCGAATWIPHETPMPNIGDELLHHFGWNHSSSACHGPGEHPPRSYPASRSLRASAHRQRRRRPRRPPRLER